MMILTRMNPAKNMRRFYAPSISPTLFGDWVLTAEWGRIGSPGTVRHQPFDTEALARDALDKHLHAKTRRGYHRWPSVTSA